MPLARVGALAAGGIFRSAHRVVRPLIFSTPIFLYFFLPVVLIVFLLSGRRNWVLLAASIVFYYWGETTFTLLLLFSVTINYFIGMAIARHGEGSDTGRLWLTGGIAVNLLLLTIFKYADFFVSNLNVVVTAVGLPALSEPNIHLPLGISFFTFQAMSYLIDVYRGTVKVEKNPSTLALYITMFPQLVAGPIVRYEEIADQLHKPRWRADDLAIGAERFVIGLAKKVIFADPVGQLADKIFQASGGDITSPVAWLGAICFTLQIYFDFSGYSDMAIGLGRMLGFRFPENFAHPYKSRSIQEFWRRWHMTLSRFFRDYLYIPLGGSRGGVLRTYANLWIVFLLCGLWHGASWLFVIWGGWHGLFLVLERTSFGRLINASPVLVKHLYVMLVVIVGWVFFRAETLPQALQMLSAMFAGGGWFDALDHLRTIANNYELFLVVVGAVLTLPIRRRLEGAIYVWRRRHWPNHSNGAQPVKLGLATARAAVYSGAVVYAMSAMAANTHQAFIYFRF